MSFWSGEKLAVELPSLISDFSNDRIDCASYRLSLGGEAFVTRDDLLDGSSIKPFTQALERQPPNDKVVIPPGQFAFLLTEEIVRVPPNAMALISMRVSQKFKGLINVSGFHVDPGYSGKLLYSVYNAGPQPIYLTRGHPLFIIVYADLDQMSARYYVGSATGRTAIDADLIQGMSGQVFSPLLLQRQIGENREKLQDLTTKVVEVQSGRDLFVTVGASFIVAVLALAATVIFSDSVKALVGGWMKGAIQLYEAPFIQDNKAKSDSPSIVIVAPRNDSGSREGAAQTGAKTSQSKVTPPDVSSGKKQ